MADVLKTQKRSRKDAEKRLKENPPRTPDRSNPLTGWTAQHGPPPPQASRQDKVAAWQLPDPRVAQRAGVPVLDIPEHMIAEDDEMGGGDVPEERMTRDGEQLLEQHPGDVPAVSELRKSREESPNVEDPADPTAGDEAPAKNASKEEWLVYARAQGFDGNDEDVTRDDLIKQYGPKG